MLEDPPAADLMRLGVIGAAHGLAGAAFLREVLDLEPVLRLKRVFVAPRGWLPVKRWQPVNAGLLLHLTGFLNREAIEALRGQTVFADPNEYALEPGRFFYHSLIGLPVLDPLGQSLGVVRDVLDTGAQDVLMLECAGRQVLVPLQAPYVRVREGFVELEPVPGLLDG